MDELWNLLWSGAAHAFHVERLSETMEKNVLTFLSSAAGRHSCDYITMYVGTFDECNRVADELRPKLLEQRRLKAAADAVVDAMTSRRP